MADSPSPRSPQSTAGQSTRQLLDELDALMQRMLAVPVQPGDSEPAPAPEPVREAAATAPRNVELVPAPIAVTAVPAADFRELAQEKPPSPVPLMPIILTRPKASVAEMPAFPCVQAPLPQRKPTAPPEALPKPPPAWMNPAATKVAPPPAATGRGTALLIALNRGYDRLTDWLGPLGRWMRGEQGRSVLGWTGLAMLVSAVVWAAFRFLG
jgi:hypothetical protein